MLLFGHNAAISCMMHRFVIFGQIKCKCAALARRALQRQFAAEQPRDLTADRKTETRSAIFAACRTVGLLECLKDKLLLVFGNSDAGILTR